jgi:hypothetical protein
MNSRISKPKPHFLSKIREILIWIGKATLYGMIVASVCVLLFSFLRIALPIIRMALKAIGS